MINYPRILVSTHVDCGLVQEQLIRSSYNKHHKNCNHFTFRISGFCQIVKPKNLNPNSKMKSLLLFSLLNFAACKASPQFGFFNGFFGGPRPQGARPIGGGFRPQGARPFGNSFRNQGFRSPASSTGGRCGGVFLQVHILMAFAAQLSRPKVVEWRN